MAEVQVGVPYTRSAEGEGETQIADRPQIANPALDMYPFE